MSLLPHGVLHPHLLPLLLAALLPILLHILDRRRARVVVWPPMRFLVDRQRSRTRRWRLRELLLIASRSLLALLFAYAALRPFSLVEETIAAPGREPRGSVIAIDCSFSMAYQPAPESPGAFALAKDSALAMLERLGPDDQVVVLALPGAPPATPLAAPLAVDDARRAVRDLRLRGGAFDLLRAIDGAAVALPRLRQARREVAIFTDLQASSIRHEGPAALRFLADRLGSPTERPALRVVDCGAAQPSNRFVATLELDPLAAGTDAPATLRVEVEGRGPAELKLEADGIDIATVLLELPGTGSSSQEIAHRFQRGGLARLTASLPRDGLALDDARHAVLEVASRIETLLVGSRLDAGPETTTRYLELALEPRAPGAAAPDVIFRAATTRTLVPGDLDGKRVVVLAGCDALDAAAATALERFVRDGGGLLVCAGEELAAAALNEHLFRGGAGILPCRLGERAEAEDESPRHPGDVASGHPALAVFSGGDQGDLSRLDVRRWRRLLDVHPEARVLARLDAEAPWLVERTGPGGKVIVLATSAGPADSDLPRTPLFLPLVHRLVRYLASPGAARRSALAGEPLRARVAAGLPLADPFALGPDGTRLPVRVLGEGDGDDRQVELPETWLPGFHELHAGPGQPPLEVFAVHLSAEESRLERAGETVLAELRSALGLEVSPQAGGAAADTATRQVRREHWPAAIGAALLLLFVEMLLARTFAKGQEGGYAAARRAEG